MGEGVIRVERLTAGFQSRTVLRGINLEIPGQGITGLMGPGGVGKSTLLRTLGRWNDRLVSFWSSGKILLGGRDLLHDYSVDEAHRVVPLLSQKARLYTSTILDNAIAEVEGERPFTLDEKEEIARQVLEPWGLWEEFRSLLLKPVLSLSIGQQRKLSIARLMANGSFLLADEPLRDISSREAGEITELLKLLARSSGILMVTHNQRRANRLCDRVYLMVGGQIIEGGETDHFFKNPSSDHTRDYIRLGSCSLEPDQSAHWGRLSDPSGTDVGGVAEEDPGDGLEETSLPGGFHWILPGQLAGMQHPGLLYNEEQELRSLQDLGCTDVVNLREFAYDAEWLEPFGFRSLHFPIVDMSVPVLQDAVDLVNRIARWVKDGRCVVLHCKAGLGRTGTMLACVLIVRGLDAVQAIHEVRSINPYYIQSEEQLDFIGRFGEHIEQSRPSADSSLVGEGRR